LRRGVEWLDYVFLARPTLFYPVWIFFLAGAAGASGTSAGTLGLPLTILGLILSYTLLMGGVYVWNQIADVETDRVNGKLFLLANGLVSVRAAVCETVLLVLLGIGGAHLFHPRAGFLAAGLFLLSGAGYNVLFRWKDRPVGGLAVNLAGGALIHLAGWVASGGPWLQFHTAAYGFAGAAVYLHTTVPDREGDAKTGKVTFVVRYGMGATVLCAFAFDLAAAVIALSVRDWILFIPAAATLPVFLAALRRKGESDSLRATQGSVMALAAAVCVIFPLFLIPIFAVYFLSKVYYQKRFGFNYPQLKVSS
jgi:4-hydroxybenzoate polyprenyltransferase